MFNKIINFSIKLIMISLLIIGCSKSVENKEIEKNYTISKKNGINTFKNNNKPSEPNLVISLKNEGSIIGNENNPETIFLSPIALVQDNHENIFILDNKTSTVKKFNKTGKFVKSFCRLGSGPGEVRDPVAMGIVNDTIKIVDGTSKRIVNFDSNGNFVNQNELNSPKDPKLLTQLGKDKFIGFLWGEGPKGKDYYVNLALTILDSKLNKIEQITFHETKFNPETFNIYNLIDAFAIGDNEIFVANPSDNEYKIDVYDFHGKKLYTIKKNYAKVQMSKSEVKDFNKSMMTAYGLRGSEKPSPKKAINSMYYDKQGRLWVSSSIKRNNKNKEDFEVDVFKDGVFLNKVNIDKLKGFDYFNATYQVLFINDKIFVIDRENIKIEIYSY